MSEKFSHLSAEKQLLVSPPQSLFPSVPSTHSSVGHPAIPRRSPPLPAAFSAPRTNPLKTLENRFPHPGCGIPSANFGENNDTKEVILDLFREKKLDKILKRSIMSNYEDIPCGNKYTVCDTTCCLINRRARRGMQFPSAGLA